MMLLSAQPWEGRGTELQRERGNKTRAKEPGRTRYTWS